MFTHIRPKRITEEIVQQIKDLIAQGKVTAGDKLPAEREMARQLGVSRPTLREALQILEHAGMLSIHQGDGTYVRDVGEQSLGDPLRAIIRDSEERIVELAEFRTAIETWAAASAAERIQEADLEELRRIVGLMREGIEKRTPIHHLDAEFHLVLARATRNGIYYHVANTIFYLFAEVTKLSHEQIYTTEKDQWDLFHEHEGIYEALREGDGQKAAAMMNLHLHNTEKWFKRTRAARDA